MAIVAGYLTGKVRGQTSLSLVSSGLQIIQVVDAPMINGIDFQIDGTAMFWDYEPTTDIVSLVTSDGFSVVLTRVGDYFRWNVLPDDLGAWQTAPGNSVTKTAYLVVERVSGGTVISRLSTDGFTLTIDRQLAFSAFEISGLFAQFDNYDATITALASGANLVTWDDWTPADRDITNSTAGQQPKRYTTPEGRPYITFDGTDDLLASAVTTFTAPCTAFVVARILTHDATVRGIVQIGGANGGRIAFDNANLKGISGADVANTTHPGLNTWFVATMTKAAAGAVTIQLNTAAAVSNASVAAVTAGTLTMGDTTADAAGNFDIQKCLVYNSVLSAAQINRVVRSLIYSGGV